MATLTMVVSRIDMMLPITTTNARRLSWGSKPARPPRPSGAVGVSGIDPAMSLEVIAVLGGPGRRSPGWTPGRGGCRRCYGEACRGRADRGMLVDSSHRRVAG